MNVPYNNGICKLFFWFLDIISGMRHPRIGVPGGACSFVGVISVICVLSYTCLFNMEVARKIVTRQGTMVYKLLHCEPKGFKSKNRWKQKARTFLFFGSTHCDVPRFRRACPAQAWAKAEVFAYPSCRRHSVVKEQRRRFRLSHTIMGHATRIFYEGGTGSNEGNTEKAVASPQPESTFNPTGKFKNGQHHRMSLAISNVVHKNSHHGIGTRHVRWSDLTCRSVCDDPLERGSSGWHQ